MCEVKAKYGPRQSLTDWTHTHPKPALVISELSKLVEQQNLQKKNVQVLKYTLKIKNTMYNKKCL